jgi:hypothetical protein
MVQDDNHVNLLILKILIQTIRIYPFIIVYFIDPGSAYE